MRWESLRSVARRTCVRGDEATKDLRKTCVWGGHNHGATDHFRWTSLPHTSGILLTLLLILLLNQIQAAEASVFLVLFLPEQRSLGGVAAPYPSASGAAVAAVDSTRDGSVQAERLEAVLQQPANPRL